MPEIRRATIADLEALVRLRVALMHEMGALDDGEAEGLAGATRRYVAEELPAGRFLAWVAVAEDGEVVGCSGMVFLRKPPSPKNHSGHEAYIMNMYTLPDWRGRGLAARLFAALVGDAREAGAVAIRLHATEAGRAIYERAGFRAVDNEMVLHLPG